MTDIVRGTSATFTAQFVDTDGEPLVAAQPAENPQVVIKDPDGATAYSGVGRAINSTSGNYQFSWFVPENYPITAADQQWRVEWFFTNLDNHTRTVEDFFRIVDAVTPDLDEAQYTYLTRAGTAERIVITLPYDPEEISLSAGLGSNTKLITNLVAGDNAEASETVATVSRKIGKVIRDGQYSFYYNTDPLGEGQYPIFWDVRQTVVSAKKSYQQLIRVPEANYWLFNKPLQIFIDRVRKRVATFQAYTEDQLYEFVIRGVGMANGVHPVTAWTLSTIPLSQQMGIAEAVLLQAAKWALATQQVVEDELSFEHGGQTVTLGMNRDYSNVISMIDGMFEKWVLAKPRIVRLSSRPGVVGVRPYFYGSRGRVWRTGTSATAQDTFAGFSSLLSLMI
jgi:hypothetical protein